MNTLRPLSYGYMRVPDDVPDHKIKEMEQRIKSYSQDLGFEFATFFYEFQCNSFNAWDELATELQRADARHVLVPSLNHVAHSPFLRISMLERLGEAAKAEVHALKEDVN